MTTDLDFTGAIVTERSREDVPREGVFAGVEVIEDVADKAPKTDWLDSPEVERAFVRNRALYISELEAQADMRADMATDEDFYDGIQWNEEELQILANRGQAATVYNLIQTSLNWILGTQRRAPMDYKVLPRTKAGSESAAHKTKLLSHVRDMNHSAQARSKAFADAAKVGIGWIETGQGDLEDGALVFDRYESWRNMVWDSRAGRDDLRDARFIARTKWMDADVARAYFPGREAVILQSVSEAGYTGLDEMGDEAMDARELARDVAGGAGTRSPFESDALRPRLRVVEFWFKRVERVAVMVDGEFNGENYDPWSPGHWNSIVTGSGHVEQRPREVIYLMVMSDSGVLAYGRSPYRHNRYPFTPIWCYRRGRDNAPYGFVRAMRDLNRSVNKFASRALHNIGSTRAFVPIGSVEDIEAFRDEVARPDSVIEYNPDGGKPEIDNNLQLSAALNEFMARDTRLIQSISGITDESMGRQTNATSGKAIMARQDQGALATSGVFDNLRLAEAIHGEKLMCNVEQFYDRQTQIRITDSKGDPVFLDLNSPDDPSTSIADFKADFVIDEEQWRATVRQADAAVLMDLLMTLAPVAPQAVIQALPILIGLMDLPNSQELEKIFRKLAGQPDPEDDPANPSPETQQLLEQQQAEAEAQQRMQEAQIANTEAKAELTKAQAVKATADAQLGRLSQIMAALEAAVTAAQAPGLAPTADAFLDAARGADQGGDIPDLGGQAVPPVPATAPMIPA